MAKRKRLSAADVMAAARASDGQAESATGPAVASLRTDGVLSAAADASGAPRRGTAVRRDVDSRRRGITLSLGFVTLGTTLGLWLLAMTRFMFPNVVRQSPTRVKIGYPADFSPGHVETRFKARYGLWVIHDRYRGQLQLYALRAVCTHMGCTPNWLETEQKFKCPCHGSGFAKDGANLEGPAPRPLERYAIRIADDGQIEIDKGRTFQEELGQWEDPACYVRV